MKNKKWLLLVVSVLFLVSCNTTSTEQQGAQQSESKTQEAVAFLKRYELAEPTPLDFVSENLMEHFANNEGNYYEAQRGKWKVEILNTLEDSEYVFVYSFFILPNATFLFPDSSPRDRKNDTLFMADLFRYEAGKIVERWHNTAFGYMGNFLLQRRIVNTMPAIKDRDKTEANKKLVRQFVQEVFVEQNRANLGNFIDTVQFVLHDADEDKDLEGYSLDFPQDLYPDEDEREIRAVQYEDDIDKVLGEGNLVVVLHTSMYMSGYSVVSSFFDLFRVENGKIVEVWKNVDYISDLDNLGETDN